MDNSAALPHGPVGAYSRDMWPFPSARSENRRIRDLEERCDTLERNVKLLRAEWDDTYDKIRISMARIVKRAAVVEAAEPGGKIPPPEAEEQPTIVNGRALTPRQMQLQQEILRRRAGL